MLTLKYIISIHVSMRNEAFISNSLYWKTGHKHAWCVPTANQADDKHKFVDNL